jgi:hypothetical protein
MRTPCAYGHGGGRHDGRAGGLQGGRGHQQLALVVDIEAHPMVELAAARLLVLATDELRADGFIVCHLRLTVEG